MTHIKLTDINTNFIVYAENRDCFYKTLFEKLPFTSQLAWFKSAVLEYANPQKVAHSLHNNFNESMNLGTLETLALAGMLKKRGDGQQTALSITSIEEALTRAQSLESTGYEFLQVILKQYLNNCTIIESFVQVNLKSLENLKRLEDDLRYGRLNI